MTSTRPRIFVAELDSVATRRLYSDHQLADVEVEARLVGALRLAHLVGGEILVTDAMLLDSRFFTELEPGELATLLGASPQRLPLTVLHREPTLAEALEAKVARGPGFRWQLAGPTPAEDWIGPDLRAAWARWVRASERGQIGSEPLLTWPDGTAKPAFRVDLDLSSTSEAAEVDELIASTSRGDRSAVFDAYDRGLASATDPAVREELRRLRSAYNTAYFDAMARQHRAEWVTFTDTGQAGAQAPGREMMRVSGHLLETATTAPPPVFAQIVHATTAEREAFFDGRRRRHLLALAFRADAATSVASLWQEVRGVARSIVFALLAVLIAVPGLGDQAGWLAWSVFAVSVLLAVPWDAPAVIRNVLPSRLDAMLSVSRS